jgi:hypothetical protein
VNDKDTLKFPRRIFQMKVKVILMMVFVSAILFTGCGNNDNTGKGNTTTTPAPTTAVTTAPTTAPTQAATPTTEAVVTTPADPDAVTTASITDKEEVFKEAMGLKGTWIIAALKDMTFEEDLVLEGEYKNGKKDDAGKDIIQRKIALYEQDENRTVTARYTLTAPKLTVTSPNARIQSGTFKGDLYVSASNFELVDATVEGNVYFTTKEAKDSFKMDDKSKVTGKQELQR